LEGIGSACFTAGRTVTGQHMVRQTLRTSSGRDLVVAKETLGRRLDHALNLAILPLVARDQTRPMYLVRNTFEDNSVASCGFPNSSVLPGGLLRSPHPDTERSRVVPHPGKTPPAYASVPTGSQKGKEPLVCPSHRALTFEDCWTQVEIRFQPERSESARIQMAGSWRDCCADCGIASCFSPAIAQPLVDNPLCFMRFFPSAARVSQL
jgi:hypothetical protein